MLFKSFGPLSIKIEVKPKLYNFLNISFKSNEPFFKFLINNVLTPKTLSLYIFCLLFDE